MLFGNTARADDILQGRLDDIIPRNASLALLAIDIASGKEAIATGTVVKEPLVPASLVKLFTTGAALAYVERHGSPSMRTRVTRDGTYRDSELDGNLYLIGQGNALLTAKDLRKTAHTLAQQGIKKVTGNIVADDSFFDTNGLDRTYNGPGHAPAGALGIDLHTVALTVIPAESDKPPRVVLEPPNDRVRVAMAARTAMVKKSTIRTIQLDDTSYRVTGIIPAGGAAVKQRFPLKEPALYAAAVLHTMLQQSGIAVMGGLRKGKAPAGAVELAEIEAPELAKLVRDMNMNSLNVIADNLLLLLGAESFGPPGTREKGIKAVNEFLATLDLPEGEATIADGSGLHSDNRVTARFMARYLAAVAKKPWFETFFNALPQAGIEGTLKEIGYKNERFRVKSGRLENAFALAGYGVDWRGRDIAFAYIVNIPGGAALNLERSGAEVMRYLAEEVLE
jgi:D-alanyl-D-alanine carboxypeptidase/D-alanyl-D-alanine-endopeptidase (penicillin-binding protein 4)